MHQGRLNDYVRFPFRPYESCMLQSTPQPTAPAKLLRLPLLGTWTLRARIPPSSGCFSSTPVRL